jgi:flagellar protein FliO/FliZ
MNSILGPLAAFVAVLALIPLALWLLKRTPIGGAAAGGVMRVVAMLPLSASQRLVTLEVGSGEDRRWLVLGVSPAGIQTLHSLPPQADAPAAPAAAGPFAALLARQQRSEDGRGR